MGKVSVKKIFGKYNLRFCFVVTVVSFLVGMLVFFSSSGVFSKGIVSKNKKSLPTDGNCFMTVPSNELVGFPRKLFSAIRGESVLVYVDPSKEKVPILEDWVKFWCRLAGAHPVPQNKELMKIISNINGAIAANGADFDKSSFNKEIQRILSKVEHKSGIKKPVILYINRNQQKLEWRKISDGALPTGHYENNYGDLILYDTSPQGSRYILEKRDDIFTIKLVDFPTKNRTPMFEIEFRPKNNDYLNYDWSLLFAVQEVIDGSR